MVVTGSRAAGRRHDGVVWRLVARKWLARGVWGTAVRALQRGAGAVDQGSEGLVTTLRAKRAGGWRWGTQHRVIRDKPDDANGISRSTVL